jgi:hypothetical protein
LASRTAPLLALAVPGTIGAFTGAVILTNISMDGGGFK